MSYFLWLEIYLKIKKIRDRALRLHHQDDVDIILNLIISRKENIRTVGYPDVS